MRSAALALLAVATLSLVTAIWVELVQPEGLQARDSGPAVFFTLAALSGPVLGWLISVRHPREWTGVQVGVMVLVAMIGGGRGVPAGYLQLLAGTAGILAVVLPAAVVVRYRPLEVPVMLIRVVWTCLTVTAVAAVVTVVSSAADVPTAWWWSADPAPARPTDLLLLGVALGSAVIGTLVGAGAVMQRYRRMPRSGRAILRPVVLPMAGWAASGSATAIWIFAYGVADPTADLTPTTSNLFGALPTVLVAVLAYGLAWVDLVVRRPTGTRNVGTRRRPADRRVERLLSRALGDPTIRVLYVGAEPGSWVDASGRPAEPDLDAKGRATVEVRRGTGAIGLIELDAANAVRPDAVELVAASAGLLMEAERLAADAHRDLELSRALAGRLLSVSDQPRAELRADLVSGPLAELDAITEKLTAGTGVAELVPRLSALAAEVRTLSHGVFPAALATGGLRAALPTISVPGHRYPPAVEMTVYLAARHDRQATVFEGDWQSEQRLIVTTVTPPSLVLRDRVTALGGTSDSRENCWEIGIPVTSSGQSPPA